MGAIATTTELEAELIERVKSVSAFQGNGFSVFDLDDMEDKVSGQTFPAAGVGWLGSEPIRQGNAEAKPTGPSHAAVMRDVQFMIVVATQYKYTGQDDTKQAVFALLDQVRSAVEGFKGVNSRPWRWMGERPEPEASGDGVVFYSQIWQTTLPTVGTFNNS